MNPESLAMALQSDATGATTSSWQATLWASAWSGSAGEPSPAARLWLGLTLIVVTVIGLQMRRRHRAVDVMPGDVSPGGDPGGHVPMGGAMSGPKAFWLPFAVYLWFAMCPAFGLDASVASPWREAFFVVGVSMWLRGAAEMLLLYVWKAWRPPMGIGHDVFTIVAALVALAVTPAPLAMGDTVFEQATVVFFVVVMLSLVTEVVHAVAFYQVMKGRTVGDDGIWFADEKDPRFAANNRRTLVMNVVLAVPTAAVLLVWAFGG